MRQVGYFYPSLDLSSGADEAPFIIHTQPADETESSLFLRSHNVPPCVLSQRRNQDPDWQYTRDSLRFNSVLANGKSIDYSSVFGLLVLLVFSTWILCFCLWLCGSGADKVWRHWRHVKERQYIFDAPVSQLSRGSVYLHILISFTLSR